MGKVRPCGREWLRRGIVHMNVNGTTSSCVSCWLMPQTAVSAAWMCRNVHFAHPRIYVLLSPARVGSPEIWCQEQPE